MRTKAKNKQIKKWCAGCEKVQMGNAYKREWCKCNNPEYTLVDYESKLRMDKIDFRGLGKLLV